MDNPSPNYEIVSQERWERRIPSTAPRPQPEQVAISCDRCGEPLTVTLEWWKPTDDGFNGEWWIIDTPATVDRNDRLHRRCLDDKLKILERAREYESDCAPAWFSEGYAGERWSEDY